MAKLLTADLQYDGDGEWDCKVRDHARGTLCLPGLENALDMTFDKERKYQLRIYDSRPRCDVVKLYLLDQTLSDGRIVDEQDERYDVDNVLIDLLDKVLVDANIETDGDEDFTVFYVRAIKKGLVTQQIDDIEFNSMSNEITVYSCTGFESVIKVNAKELKWVACE